MVYFSIYYYNILYKIFNQQKQIFFILKKKKENKLRFIFKNNINNVYLLHNISYIDYIFNH
jgi:hypothetical protein